MAGAVTPPLRAGGARLAGVVAVDIGWLVARPHVHGGWIWPPLLAALAVHAAVVWRERRSPCLPARTAVVATAVVLAVAVALPVYGSHDLYAYAFSGRMVALHHANPYFVVPTHYPHDPLLRSVAPPWRRVPTVYGPVFTAVSALGALGFGTSPLLARLCFQGLAAGALLVVVWLLARRRVPVHVVLFVGLAPPLVAAVNGGHNDVIAGALLLAGVLALDHPSRWRAGGLLAAAVLVKLLVVPGLACLLVALALRGRRAEAARVSAVVVGATVVGYLLVGGPGALRPVTASAQAVSRASAWHELNRVIVRRGGPAWTAKSLRELAMLLTLVAGLVFVVRLRRGAAPAVAAAGGVLVFLLTSQYVLPWYSALALPVAALATERVRWMVHAQAALLLLAYAVPPGQLVHPVRGVEGVTAMAAYAQVALLVALLVVPLGQGVETATKSLESGVR